MRKWILLAAVLAVIALAAAVALASRGETSGEQIPQATPAELAAAGLDGLPLAPASARVDLATPTFSDPTTITNPLFPIGRLRAAVLLGTVDGKRFKAETTLLPGTRVFQWPDGRQVQTLVSQYVAYLDGRLDEVALDHYAQDDDGSVWYFGEDVFNYADGMIGDTEGTWLAGSDGPAAMIMPADPRVGDVYRPENIPGLVFEEVAVKAVDRTMAGPSGPVAGAVVGRELHADGAREDKTFAPGYGEFFTGSGGDVEAMALAVPADRLASPPSAGLQALLAGADDVFEDSRSGNWHAATSTLRRLTRIAAAFEAPERLGAQMRGALARLQRSVAARDPVRAATAAVDLGQAVLDLELRHRSPAEIDRARFELWARQLVVDAEARDEAGVRGDLAALEWIRDRFAHTLRRVDTVRIDSRLLQLRAAVNDEDLGAAAAQAALLAQP